MRILTPLLIGALVATGGVAIAGKKSSKEDKYEITEIGEPENCIRRSQIRSTDVISDSIIDFKMRGGDVYRNSLPNRCSGLAFEEAFSYRTSVNQLCSVDIIRVIDNSGGAIRERNACGLGKFQKIEKTKKADKEG